MAKIDTSSYNTFDEIASRLDEIVDDVRDKDISLERSLDLLDEAIVLGSKAVGMVDKVDFTPEESRNIDEKPSSVDSKDSKANPA